MANRDGKPRPGNRVAGFVSRILHRPSRRERDLEMQVNDQATQLNDQATQLNDQATQLNDQDSVIKSMARKLDLKEGTFFTKTEEVWMPEKVEFAHSFEAIRRPEGYYKGIPSYDRIVSSVKQTIEASNIPEPRLDSVSTSSNSGAKGTSFLGTDGREIGHQFPDAKTCAPTHGIASQPILGFDAEAYCAENNLGREGTIQTLQHLVCSNSSDRSFGLRSVPENHLFVPENHAQYYDESADWIIVPIVTKEKMMKWKQGEEYSVMVLARTPAAYKALLTEDYQDAPDGIRQRCSKKDVETATELLRDFMKANADALLGRPTPEDKEDVRLTPFDLFEASENGEVKKNLEQTRKSLSSEYKVQVPKMKPWDENWEILKVRLTNKSSVPDPAIVAQKAAINCSDLYQQMLLPACPELEEEEEDPEQVLAYAHYYSSQLQQQFLGNHLVGGDSSDVDNESLSGDEEEFPAIISSSLTREQEQT